MWYAPPTHGGYIHTRRPATRIRTSVMAAQQQTIYQAAARVAACVGLLAIWTVYSGINRFGNYRHYTAWNLTLVLATVVYEAVVWYTGAASTPERPAVRAFVLVVLPITLGSVVTVAVATIFMFAYRVGEVQEAFDEHGAVVVHLANILLHAVAVPVVGTVCYVYRDTTTAAIRVLRAPRTHTVNLFVTATVWASTYFYSYSLQSEYKFDSISNHTARTACVYLMAGTAVSYTLYHLHRALSV